MKRKIVFIINPHSGTDNKVRMPKLIEDNINREAFDYEIVFTEYAGHAADIAKDCASRGIDIVVAVGGDGTINEVARSIVHTDTALGIIPCGSGNGLARHLCIPLDPRKAISIINRACIESLDYGVINDLPFFCTCGMGFDAFISYKFAGAGKRGPMTYIENVLKEGLKYKPETYEVEIEDEKEPQKYNAFLIACANASQYGNNAYIAPRASMQDGLIDVTIIRPFNPIETPIIGIQLFTRQIDKNTNIQSFRTRELTISRPKAAIMHVDGEPLMMEADLHIKCHPSGINIITPTKESNSIFQPIESGFYDFLNAIRAEFDL